MADISSPSRVAPRQPSARLIVVQGEIGTGKTELCKLLDSTYRKNGYNVCLVLEPVEKWREVGILEQFYADRERFAYSFQTFVFATRCMAIAEAVKANPDADFYILERCPAIDRVFMELQRDLITPSENAMYDVWCRAYENVLPINLSTAKVLYLRTSLGVSMERLRLRAREGEVGGAGETKKIGVTREYQQQLREAHEAFLLGQYVDFAQQMRYESIAPSPYPRDAVIVIPAGIADSNFRDSGEEQTAAIAYILDEIEQRA